MQSGQQLRHRLRLVGQDEVGRDFRQRLQHKASLMCARMRQGECGGGANLIAERNQVQVERARLIEHLLGPAAKFRFQRLQFSKQAFRCFVFVRNQSHDGI